MGIGLFLLVVAGCGVPRSIKTEPSVSPETPPELSRIDPEDQRVPFEADKLLENSSQKILVPPPEFPRGSQASSFPFSVGEQLEYDVTWFGISAGTILMEVTEPKGAPYFLLRVLIQTSSGFSVFYRIHDLMEIFVDKKTLLPLRVVLHRDEGKKQEVEETVFYRDRGEVETLKGGERKKYSIPLEARDEISAIYWVRGASLASIGSMRIPVFSSKRTYDVKIQAVRKERIKTVGGEIEALVVRPEAWYDVEKKEKGEVDFWLTEDARHVPVQIRAKVKIGSLFLRLKNYRWGEGTPS